MLGKTDYIRPRISTRAWEYSDLYRLSSQIRRHPTHIRK